MHIQLLPQKIPVGISRCAVGDPVRYNGSHKHSKVCTQLLGNCFELQAYCPEVAIGMGVPRPPIHLIVSDRLRAVGREDPSLDVTEALEDYADQLVPEVENLRGFILMQKSPSCGVRTTPHYKEDGTGVLAHESGLFAARLRRHFPHLPMEEVGRLNASDLRENFLTRVFAYDAWYRYVATDLRPARVIEFYTAYKYLLLAHSQPLTRALGQFVSNSRAMPVEAFAYEVRGKIMEILGHLASRKDRTNALMHSQGHLKGYLNKEERNELALLIDDYRRGNKPLSAVLTMLRHYLPRSPHQFIHSQVLLAAEPAELGLCDFR
ncbi:YbgA family protein [Microbulbifer sp. CnH-101-G]|uniref:YbgA family protein n=1 Tax=Microbulbifer sp. CnH-101-G TaxID=3243393 RepID=UPI004039B581